MMSTLGSDFRPLRVCVPLGQMDASEAEEKAVWCNTTPAVVIGSYLLENTDKNGHAANYGTYTLTNKGTSGAGTTVVATRATDTPTTDDVTAFKKWPLTLSSSAADLELAANSVLAFKAEETGTAGSGDLTDAVLVIEYADGTGVGQ